MFWALALGASIAQVKILSFRPFFASQRDKSDTNQLEIIVFNVLVKDGDYKGLITNEKRGGY